MAVYISAPPSLDSNFPTPFSTCSIAPWPITLFVLHHFAAVMSDPIEKLLQDLDLTDRQRTIIDLLRLGYSTGFIQKSIGAARTTISHCKSILQKHGHSTDITAPADLRAQIFNLLLTRLRSGGPGSVSAGQTLLRYLQDVQHPAEPTSLTADEACTLLYQWHKEKNDQS